MPDPNQMKDMHTVAAPSRAMMVGFNYSVPWNAYGYYFGGGYPPGSNPALDQWPTNLKTNLFQLRDIGVSVVRIFLLGNALNYGVLLGGGRDLQLPPQLHPKFKQHLTEMLEAFAQTEMKVIPSLIDFKAFGRSVVLGKDAKGNPYTNGCTDKFLIAQRTDIRDAFFAQTLEEFVRTAEPYKSVVYAWEIQNEPVWNTDGNPIIPVDIAGGKTIEESTMTDFLEAGIDVVAKFKDVKSTVGHRWHDDLKKFPTGKLRQFHYYPKRFAFATVADISVPPYKDTNAFVGEFGALGKDSTGKYPHGTPWPELNGADDGDAETRVKLRLQLLRSKGYPLALIWPDGPGGTVPGPDPIKLTAGAMKAIEKFCNS